MQKTNARLRWARKILQAKSFIVLTDKESVIALSGVDPNKLTDVLALQEQAASINAFIYMLEDLRRDHNAAIEKIMERSAKEAPKNRKVPVKRHKKVAKKG